MPTTRGGSAQPITARNAYQAIPYFTAVARRAARKLSRRGEPALPAAQAEVSAERNRRAVEALRHDGVLDVRAMRSAGLYEPRALEAFVASAGGAQFTDWPMIGRIATLECALRAGAPG